MSPMIWSTKTSVFQLYAKSSTTEVPWYVTNDMIYKDLSIPAVHEVIHDRSTMVCHQWYDPQRSQYSGCTRSHPRQKYYGMSPMIWSTKISVFRLYTKSSTTEVPWYVTNDMIHKDHSIPAVHEVIHDRSTTHSTKLESHSNPLIQPLPRNNVIRILKRRWPADL